MSAVNNKLQLSYASLSSRAMAIIVDWLLCAIFAAGMQASIESVHINIEVPFWVYFSIFALYFVGLISRRFNATLGMRLMKLRIIRLDGQNLEVWRAALHVVCKFATLYALIIMVVATVKSDNIIVGVIGFVLLLILVFHPRRQALHNILLGTQVLYGNSQLACHAENINNEKRYDWHNWKSIAKAVGDLCLLIFFLGILQISTSAYHDRDLISRSYYALSRAQELQIPIEGFYNHYGHFPVSAEERAEIPVIAFPAGGGARLDNDGEIRIWFDILPELKAGVICLIPEHEKDKGFIHWTCKSKGIENKWLPNLCRE